MKHSEILRAAKQHLEHPDRPKNGYYSSEFICDCVRYVGRVTDSFSQVKDITHHISKSIEDKFGVDRWLVHIAGIDPKLVWSTDQVHGEPTKELQDYRLAWMERLAQEYESKGM